MYATLKKHLVGIFHSTYMLGGYSERFSNLVTLRAYRCKTYGFPSTSSGATVGYSYEMQKANKTYKCNDLEVCSTLGQQLAKGDTISPQDVRLLEELLKTACRRCRCCSRNQSCATRRKCRVDYLRELKR